MKERPIIFNTEMVRAILDGRKTQTRRVMNPKPFHYDGMWMWNKCAWGAVSNVPTPEVMCPYGIAGDRLWVRETFCKTGKAKPIFNIEYKASADHFHCKWISPIHMPKWASRITLEIKNIRVEKIQDISEQDAKAEGVKPLLPVADVRYKAAFQKLWDSINATRGFSWESNPWVWVIEFKKL